MEKIRTRFIFACTMMLAATGLAFAAFTPNMAYFNVTKGQVCTFVGMQQKCEDHYYLSQSSTGCTVDAPTPVPSFPYVFAAPKPCFMSVGPFTTAAEVNEGLAELISTVWNDKNNHPLHLESDIDLGGFDSKTAEEACDAQLVPLSYLNGQSFLGEGHLIKNLCYVHDVADSVMSRPVGLFSSISEGYAADMRIKNVRIIIKDSRDDVDASTTARDYFPVGALFGSVHMATVANVTLEDVTIRGPIAGGIAGYAGNSTIRNILATDDLIISNNIEVTPADGNFAGKALEAAFNYSTWPSEYTVFLGGVVGMAVNDSLYGIKIRGKIRDNSSANTPSALGGLAGMMAYVDMDYAAFRDTLELKPATGDSGAGYTTVSGGRAMGGLFGEVSFMPFGATKNYTIQDVVVDSVRLLKGMSDNVYAGGLVGRIGFQKGNSVKIMNARASVNIDDSLKTAGDYRFFAGGFVGTTSECTAQSGESSFLSIVGSTSKGAIRVAANAAEVAGLKADVSLGGMVGSGCFASSADAFTNNTSSMVVESAAKTGSENVFVGGFVGQGEVANNTALQFKNVRFTGRAVAADSTDKVYLGGILGGFVKQQRGVSFTLTTVENASAPVVELNSNGVSGAKAVAYVGGLCGYAASLEGISLSAVTGEILVDDADFGGDSLFVGGLVAKAQSDKAFDVKNTYTVGSIEVKENTRANAKAYLGYIAGRLAVSGTLTRRFVSNYHFSDEDAEYLDAFGALSNGTDLTSTWKSGVASWTTTYNVRNGEAKALTALNNGTLTNAEMQVEEFAGKLNKGQTPYAWSYETGLNDNLPIFAINGHTPVTPKEETSYTITFAFYEWDEEVSVFVNKDHYVVAPAGVTLASVAPEVPQRDGFTFTGWDKSGDMVVSSNMKVTAQYSKNSYVVEFVINGKTITKDFFYGDMPTYDGEHPTKPETQDYTYWFTHWSPDFQMVDGPATYTAMFDSSLKTAPQTFHIRFANGPNTVCEGDSVYGAIPVCNDIPTRPATQSHSYTFKGWDPEIGPVTGEQTYMAVFDSVAFTFTVKFLNDIGEEIETQTVAYGEAAVAPKDVVGVNGVFTGWNVPFDNITGNLVVTALVKKAEVSSSSVVPASSSVEPVSSSSVEPTSSSVEPQSSSVEPESSSEKAGAVVVEIVEPKIEQSGNNAIRLTFGTNIENTDDKVTASVELLDDMGRSIEMFDVESVKEGSARTEWELYPAPIGKYKVVLTVECAGEQDSYEAAFEVAGEIVVTPRSWQMVSLAALSSENKLRTDDDALYWWDEANPVGEYWQYRSYKAGENDDPSRGYWYGTRSGNPLILKEETPTTATEIVWELDSIYSGWNLVANPHGWRIDLSGGKGGNVVFWQWNPVKGGYEMPTELGPYEAVWAKVSEPTTWTVSTKPLYGKKKDESALKKVLAKAGSDEWNVRVKLSDEFGKQDSWNFIAAGTSGNMDEPPSGMGDHVNLSIVENGKFLAKSTKAVADEYVWQMEASASDYRDGFLTFEGVDALAAKGLKLIVTVDGKTTEVSEGKSVKVLLKQSATPVTVRVARSGAVVAAKASLGELRMVQRPGLVDVGFDVPADMAGANVQVDIVSLDGKVVDRSKFTATAGSNLATLKSPHRGLYYVRVRAGNLTAIKKTLVK